MTSRRSLDVPDAYLQAALWLQKLEEEAASLDAGAEFEKWRSARPENDEILSEVRRARMIAQSWRDAPEIVAVRRETLERDAKKWEPAFRNKSGETKDSKALSDSFLSHIALAWPVMTSPRKWGGMAKVASAAMLTLAVLGGIRILQSSLDSIAGAPAAAPVERGALYRTNVGERMSVALADGSTVALDTASRLRVIFTPTQRRLVLESGQAMFEVATDAHRPFVVTAQDRTITAHGTRFDIRIDRHRLEVALVEGVVMVQPLARDLPGTSMSPNDYLVAVGARTFMRRIDNIERLTSWRDGMVMLDNDSLATAVAEMNRYVSHPLVIRDRSLGSRSISGAFRAGDMQTFMEAISLYFPDIVVRHTDAGYRLDRRHK